MYFLSSGVKWLISECCTPAAALPQFPLFLAHLCDLFSSVDWGLALISERGSVWFSTGLGTSLAGGAGDSLENHNMRAFSTKDRDNDQDATGSCAMTYKGGWWYNACHASNLNGLYHHGNHSSYADGVNWKTWKGYHYSVKRAEMKIRPGNFQTGIYRQCRLSHISVMLELQPALA